ncbi:hypothetical protein GCM10027449_28010 [Sinomonas notoginsengisoli]
MWILLALGAAGLLTAVPTFVFLLGMSGSVSPMTALPAMTIYSVMILASLTDIVCALSLRRGGRWPRLVVTLVPAVALVLMFAAMVLGLIDSGRYTPHQLPFGTVLLSAAGTVLTQGVTVLLVFVPVGLLWSRAARPYFGPRSTESTP